MTSSDTKPTTVFLWEKTMDSFVNNFRAFKNRAKKESYVAWLNENKISANVVDNVIEFTFPEDALLFKLTFKV